MNLLNFEEQNFLPQYNLQQMNYQQSDLDYADISKIESKPEQSQRVKKRRNNDYTRKRRGRARQQTQQTVAEGLASQLSNLTLKQARNKSQPKSQRMQVEPSRRQAPRQTKAKIQEAGALNVQELQKKCVQREARAAKVQSKKADTQAVVVNNQDFLDPYAKIKSDQNLVEHDILCDVCLEDDDYEGDEILICELCLAATHQSCYGGDIMKNLPRENEPWYCARCEVIIKEQKNPEEIKCILCPDLDGIIKPVDTQKKQWAHVICVNWTPEVWFQDEAKTKICGVINELRKGISCNYCHTKQGSIIQCDYQNCSKSYHVRCAAKLELIKDWDTMQAELGNPQNCMHTPVFCKEHQQAGQRCFQQMGEQGLQIKKNQKNVVKPKIAKEVVKPKIAKIANKNIRPKRDIRPKRVPKSIEKKSTNIKQVKKITQKVIQKNKPVKKFSKVDKQPKKAVAQPNPIPQMDNSQLQTMIQSLFQQLQQQRNTQVPAAPMIQKNQNAKQAKNLKNQKNKDKDINKAQLKVTLPKTTKTEVPSNENTYGAASQFTTTSNVSGFQPMLNLGQFNPPYLFK